MKAPEPAPLRRPSWGGTDFSQLPKVEAEGWISRVGFERSRSYFTAARFDDTLESMEQCSGDGSLAELTPYAQRIHDAGMQVMLTFHYSNRRIPVPKPFPQWASLSDSDLGQRSHIY